MEILSRATVWTGSFLSTILITYRDHEGRERTWEAAERVRCDGIVTIVPVTESGELLLIRQFRPVVNNFVVEFPAGLNDRGESLEEAAKRELVEETGYSSDTVLFLSEGPISSGLSTEILSVFLAVRAVPASPEIKRLYPPDESEDIEVITIPFSSPYEPLDAMRENGDLIDLKIYGLLDLAKRKMEDLARNEAKRERM